LEPFGLPGGDSSVYHPERIAHWLSTSSGHEFTVGSEEQDDVLVSSHDRSVMTTSMGRVLDALSSLLLGVTWRSYDGEPAIRLEGLLASSRSPMEGIFKDPIRDGVVPVLSRWRTLLEHLEVPAPSVLSPGIKGDRALKADLAMGMVGSIIDDLVRCTIDAGMDQCDENGRPYVGMTGGVAYNIPLVKRFIRSVKDQGGVPVLHSRVPPGDGGISVGQVMLGGLALDRNR
jgi:hydrogenase maturation protein HypF